jgi:WD40 repeat protein
MPNDATPRVLVAAGTAEYEYVDPLGQVPIDVATITDMFVELGCEQAFTGGIINPSTPEALKSRINDFLRSRDDPDSAIIIYYSGHGEREGSRHYLFCKNTAPGELAANGLPTEDFVRIAASHGVRRMLLIVDACHAGQGAVASVREVAELMSARLAAAAGESAAGLNMFAVIVAARSKEIARDGEFARAFKIAIQDRKLRGQRPPYLAISDIVNRINEEFVSRGILQHADSARVGQDPTFGFIPNPDYLGELSPEGTDLAEQRAWASPQARMRREELALHFSPRGRGSEFSAEAGHFFTGRVKILSVLARWLRREPTPDKPLVFLTGSAGTGKSAILGRLVARSDPIMRAAIPEETVPQTTDVPPRTIDVAIHARRKTMEDVIAALADVAGPSREIISPQTIDELIDALRSCSRPLTIVVDAIDEAGSADSDEGEARRIASLLCALVNRVPEIRIVAGARPEILGSFGSHATVYNLDELQWVSYSDIAHYAEQLLASPHGLGSTGCYSPIVANIVGGAIGRRSHPNYLVARLTARALAVRAEPVDTTEIGWEEMLPAALGDAQLLADPVAEAFQWALQNQLGSASRRAQQLLRPLAFAEGAGLPWHDIWAGLASALSDQRATEEDIAWVLSACAQYIVEGLDEHGRSVYRLYHQSLADYLRDGAPEDTAARITRALIASTPIIQSETRPDWQSADPYVIAHLATHAQNTSLLDSLINDAEFLVNADPKTLIPSLVKTRGKQAKSTAAVYRASAYAQPFLDPDDRRQLLTVDAMRHGVTSLAKKLLKEQNLSRSDWQLQWATGANATSSLILNVVTSFDRVHSVSVGRVGQRTVVFSGDRSGQVLITDLSSSEIVGESIQAHDGGVEDLVCTRIGGETVAVSAGADGKVCVISANSNSVIAKKIVAQGMPLRAVCCGKLGRKPVAMVGGDDGALRILGLPDLKQIGEPLTGHPESSVFPFGAFGGGICAIATFKLGDRQIAVTAGGALMVNVWDVSAGELIGSLEPHSGSGHYGHTIWSVDITEINEIPVAVTGDDEGWIRVWDLRFRREIRELAIRHAASTGPRAAVRALKCFRLNGRPSIISCSGQVLQTWDLASGVPISGPMEGDVNVIQAADFTRSRNTPIAVTGGNGGVIRAWRLDAKERSRRLPGHASVVHCARFMKKDYEDVLVSASFDGQIQIRNSSSGQLVSAFSASGEINAISHLNVRGTDVLFIASDNGALESWDMDQVSRIAGPVQIWSSVGLDTELCSADAIACASLNGRRIVVTGGSDNTVRIWNQRTLQQIGNPLTGHRDWVTAIACTMVDGRLTAVTGGRNGAIRLWDLSDRSSRGVVGNTKSWIGSISCATVRGASLAAMAADDGAAELWDLGKKVRLARWAATGVGRLSHAEFVPGSGGRFLATAGGDAYLRWWDLEEGRMVREMLFPQEIRAVAFRNPGEMAISFGWDVALLTRHIPPQVRLLWNIFGPPESLYRLYGARPRPGGRREVGDPGPGFGLPPACPSCDDPGADDAMSDTARPACSPPMMSALAPSSRFPAASTATVLVARRTRPRGPRQRRTEQHRPHLVPGQRPGSSHRRMARRPRRTPGNHRAAGTGRRPFVSQSTPVTGRRQPIRERARPCLTSEHPRSPDSQEDLNKLPNRRTWNRQVKAIRAVCMSAISARCSRELASYPALPFCAPRGLAPRQPPARRRSPGSQCQRAPA